MNLLDGKSALITGAGRGFGLAITRALAAAGCRVTLVARTSLEIEEAAAAIDPRGNRARATAGNVIDGAAVESIYDAHVAAYGAPDVLVNCAAITHPYGPIGAINVEQWWETQEIIVKGSLHFIRRAIPDMVKNGGGRIINVASISARQTFPNTSAYSVAKTALVRLTEFIAVEHGKDGIRAFAVHPGVAFSRASADALVDAEAARWIPDFLQLIKVSQSIDPADALQRCAKRCVELAAGQHDDLSGRFLNFEQPGFTEVKQA